MQNRVVSKSLKHSSLSTLNEVFKRIFKSPSYQLESKLFKQLPQLHKGNYSIIQTMDTSTPLRDQPIEGPQNTTNQLSFLGIFPPEVRMNVFECVILDSVVNPPSLLVALQGHPNPQLYAEAKDVHDRVYRSINSSSAAAFQREPLKERLKIKHLEVEMPVNFRGHTILMMNNLRILTLDYTTDAITMDDPNRSNSQPTLEDMRHIVPLLINASKKKGTTQVRKVVLKRREGLMRHRSGILERDQSVLLDNFSEAFGSDPVENGVLDGGVLYWVWEAQKGEALTWTAPRNGVWRRTD